MIEGLRGCSYLNDTKEPTGWPGLKVGNRVSGVGVVDPGFFFGEVFLAFEVEAGAHFGEA